MTWKSDPAGGGHGVLYLWESRLKALLLGYRGRSQAWVGRTEQVAGVHVEGRDLGCRTYTIKNSCWSLNQD